MDKRYIDLEGTFNFRDSGGYLVNDDFRVKYNLIYRSDELSKLTNADVEKITKLNIKTIIDYRGKQERINNEDVAIPNTKIFYLDPIADIAALASAEFGEQGDIYDMSKMNAKLAKFLMVEQNKEFVRSDKCKESFRTMFKLYLDESNLAIVQHCRGGKDRTGYGIALLLLVLGVSKEDVLKDYMLTNKYKKEKNEKSLEELYQKTKNDDLVQAIRYFKEASEEFLLTALDMIDNDYGGIINYVKNHLLLTDENIAKLKSIYLEKNN